MLSIPIFYCNNANHITLYEKVIQRSLTLTWVPLGPSPSALSRRPWWPSLGPRCTPPGAGWSDAPRPASWQPPPSWWPLGGSRPPRGPVGVPGAPRMWWSQTSPRPWHPLLSPHRPPQLACPPPQCLNKDITSLVSHT